MLELLHKGSSMQRKSSYSGCKMKILIVIVIFALFLINPIVGLAGLALVLAGIFGYIFFKAKTEDKTHKATAPKPKSAPKEKDDLEWIDRIEEYDAATDDEE